MLPKVTNGCICVGADHAKQRVRVYCIIVASSCARQKEMGEGGIWVNCIPAYGIGQLEV